MERRKISEEILKKVEKDLPTEIVKMLPESPKELLKYADRVVEIQFSDNIKEEVKNLMKEHLLNDEEYLKTFYYVMAVTFYNKKPVENPKIAIVAAQTGSGKSNLTAKLLREDPNYIFVDSDKYKHFRYDAKDIAEKNPVLYPNLTGPDGYDHAANIYKYAIDHKYNIIKETAPMKNKSLIEIDQDVLKTKGYSVSLHILAVGRINSLLSVHERYEQQIIHGLKTAKLTPIVRHNESYDSLISKVNEVENSSFKDSINIYIRGKKEENFNPICIYPGNKYKTAVEAIEDARIDDNNKTKEEFKNRYKLIKQFMEKRNAPQKQFEQLEEIKNFL